jgi:hypothetical protein
MRELVLHYQSQKDFKALDALTLWFIAQYPEARVGWWRRPEWDSVRDQDVYTRGKQLWEEQLKKTWDTPWVYMNAAEFLSGNDNEQAEQILLEGQRRFPATGKYSGLHWEMFLARHYAWALTNSAGQLPDRDANPPHNSVGLAPGPYAQKVRETLLASKDTELLNRTVEQLQINLPNREFCRSLIERVLAIDANNRIAHMERYDLRRLDIELRAQSDPRGLSDSDRIALLQTRVE